MLFNNGGTLYSGTPGSTCVFGGFVVQGAQLTVPNSIIQAVNYAPSTNATSGATGGVGNTLSPVGTRVPVVVYPTAAYAPQVSPAPSNFVFMLDLRGYPADIASVHLQYAPAPGPNGALPAIATSGNAQVLMVDNVNKFVYGVIMSNGGGNITPQNGSGVSFAVFFKDSASA